MTTIHVGPSPTIADLAAAVDWLRAGRAVVFPTDTFYGLAVDPRSDEAARVLFDLKRRPSSSASPLIGASRAQVEACCGALPPMSARLAEAFWPGPLSIVCDAPAGISPLIHAGAGTLAIRVPADDVARARAEAWGAPLTATSANITGEPPARTLAAMGALLDDPRVLAIDAGPSAGGAPSTIVDARRMPPVLVRAGAIAWDRVLESLQEWPFAGPS
jgi:L-threonylcarbamoyladenylate synthase